MPGTSSPAFTISPFSSQITRLQVSAISPSWWATRNTVPACARNSSIRAWLLRWNSASPVASASSTSRMSWLLAEAMANRSRDPMPLEYAFIGRLMKSPTPENSTICGLASLTSCGAMPMARQPRTTFRSPVRSSSSAAFTPSSAPCPSVYTAPFSAGSSPAIARSRVDLPEPFRPITPTASPR